jgi:hypothetical protein
MTASAFDQPVFNLSYNVTLVGTSDTRDIQAFDVDGAALATLSDTGTGVHAISSELADVGITSYVDSSTAAQHNVRSIEFTFCP